MKKTTKTRKMIRSRMICKFKGNAHTTGYLPTDYTTTTTTATTTTGFN